MPSQEEIEQQMQLLQAHRRTLSAYLKRQALVGSAYAPPEIAHGILESRASIRRIKEILRIWNITIEDHPDDENWTSSTAIPTKDTQPSIINSIPLPDQRESWLTRLSRWFSDQREPRDIKGSNPQLLVDLWQRARASQTKVIKPRRVASDLRTFLDAFCERLDFVVVPESYHVHHNRVVLCSVEAPALHINIPTVFPLALVLDENLPSAELSRTVDHLSSALSVSKTDADFGLILIPGSHRRMQQIINDRIRPAMKSDLIALGDDFLIEITTSAIPQTVLLRSILREVDLTRVSPFMPGGANLTDRMFFGREGELKNIAESIEKTSIAITCGRRMGKTTLLNRLERRVLPARGHTCFFLNCQPVHDYHELLTEMSAAWQRPGLPFDPLQPNSFARVVATLASTTGKPPIFLLDEVDELLRYDGQNQQRLFTQLRALSLEGRARFIMTGERSVQNHLHDANSPLFNFFGLSIPLSFLDLASVNKLIIEPLNEMQIDLEDPLPMVNTIFEMTSGHPYLVQRLCQLLVQAISRQRVRIIGPEHIEFVLNESVYQEDYFETVWGQAPPLAKLITTLVGGNGATMKEIQQLLRQRDIDAPLREINTALDVLELYSVFVRRSERYHFAARAFPEMLQRAYGNDLDTNIELLREEYRWKQQTSSPQVP